MTIYRQAALVLISTLCAGCGGGEEPSCIPETCYEACVESVNSAGVCQDGLCQCLGQGSTDDDLDSDGSVDDDGDRQEDHDDGGTVEDKPDDGVPGDGQPCESGSDCPEGMYCANWILEPGADERCHDGSDGDPCYTDRQCLSDLFCNDYHHECRYLGEEGEMCRSDNDCAKDFYCADRGGGDDRCHDGDEGDPCGSDSDCADGFYCPSLYDDKCHDGSMGDPCTSGDCQEGLLCNHRSDTCVDPCIDGCPCAYDSDCADDSYCANWSDGDDRCYNGDEGDPCSVYGGPCLEGFVCHSRSETCQEPGSEGSDCGDDDDCEYGLYCADHSSGDDLCHDGSEGDPCLLDRDCQAGLECNRDDVCAP